MNLLKYSLVASPQMQAKKAGDTHWSIAISKQRINSLHITQKAAIAKAIANWTDNHKEKNTCEEVNNPTNYP